MKRYQTIIALAIAALLAGGIGAGLLILFKHPVPQQPVPGTVLESETVKEEHEAEGPQNGRSSEDRDGSEHNALPEEENGAQSQGEPGLTAGVAGDLVKAKDAPGQSRESYCLVSENGFLLVFAEDRSSVCLDTHMPLAEFPLKEQERLLDGIWFESMLEVFNYLESFTS